jgi:hypothetical protein
MKGDVVGSILRAFRHHSRLPRVAVAIGTIGIGSLPAVGGSGVALGASSVPMYVCGRESSGSASNIIHKQWQKQPPGCRDFNLVAATASAGTGFDYYTGWYWNGRNWIKAASGAHKVYDGSNFDVVLLTNVATGTWMSITGTHEAPDSVTVDY